MPDQPRQYRLQLDGESSSTVASPDTVASQVDDNTTHSRHKVRPEQVPPGQDVVRVHTRHRALKTFPVLQDELDQLSKGNASQNVTLALASGTTALTLLLALIATTMSIGLFMVCIAGLSVSVVLAGIFGILEGVGELRQDLVG